MIIGIIIFITFLVLMILYFRTIKFRRMAKDVIRVYNNFEKYFLCSNNYTKSTIFHSEFYNLDLDFSKPEQCMKKIGDMLASAISCFKQQNVLEKLFLHNLIFELNKTKDHLIIIFAYSK